MHSAQLTSSFYATFNFIVYLQLLCPPTHCADIEVHCTNFTHGVLSFATATVNGNKVTAAPCTPGSLTSVVFHFVNKATGKPVVYASAKYDPKFAQCQTAWTGNARCVRRDPATNVYTYEVRFQADKSLYSNKFLSAVTNCVPKNAGERPFTYDYKSCDPLPIVTGSLKRADIQLQCTHYVDGQLSFAMAIVDAHKVNAHPCKPKTLTSVWFEFRDKATNKMKALETVKYNPVSGLCDTKWKGNTRCVKKDTATNIYTLQVRFLANQAKHSRQYLTATTDCVAKVGSQKQFTVDFSSCDPIRVYSGDFKPTTTLRDLVTPSVRYNPNDGVTQTQEAEGNISITADEGEDRLNRTLTKAGARGLGLGLSLGVVAIAFAAAMGVAVAVYSCRKRRPKDKESQLAANVTSQSQPVGTPAGQPAPAAPDSVKSEGSAKESTAGESESNFGGSEEGTESSYGGSEATSEASESTAA